MVVEVEQSSVEQQLVVFDLAEQQYGVNISTVREIIRMSNITHVPDAPPSVEGVINLRGGVIPVVDLRKRFSLEVSEATDRSRIVVVELGGDSIGVIVDGVAEVLRIQSDSVEDAASVVTTADSFYIEGIAKIDGQLLILLDLEKALSGDALAKLAAEWAVNPPQFLSAIEVDDGAGDDDEAAEDAAADTEPEPETEEKPVPEKKAEAKVEPKVADAEPEPLPLNLDLLEATFDAVAPRGDDVVAYFYDQLFEQHPGVMPLFENTDMTQQRGKLLAALATVVASLRTPEALVEHLQELDARHVDYGAEPEHYAAVGAILLQSLAHVAGDAWSDEAEQAWSEAYALVSSVMIDAALASQEQAAA